MIDRLKNEVEVIERHLDVLQHVIENEPIGIVKVSDETGYPHHKVRYSLRILERNELIESTGQGAVTTDAAAGFIATHHDKIDTIIDQLDGIKTGNDPILS